MTKYEELKNRITKYVPEIMDLKFGCKIKMQSETVIIIGVGHTDRYIHYKRPCGDTQRGKIESIIDILGRDITLEDVILAMGEGMANEITQIYRGHLEWQFDSKEPMIKWKLNTLLHEQSEETIDKLLEIIK